MSENYKVTASHLDDANLVCNVKRINVPWQANVSLLGSIGPDQCVDLLSRDLIQPVDSHLNLALVGLGIDDEYQCVVVFDLLHCRLSGEWELEDSMLVKAGHVCNAAMEVRQVSRHSAGRVTMVRIRLFFFFFESRD